MTCQFFTPTLPVLKNAFEQSNELVNQLALPKIERAKLEDWPLFVTDTNTQADAGQLNQQEENVIICDWETAQKQYAKLFEKFIFQAIPANQDKISAYNLANLSQAYFIYVPDNYQTDQVLEWVVSLDQRPHQYLLLVLGKNAQLTFFEKIQQEKVAKTSQSYIVEVMLQEDARLHYVAIDQSSTDQASYIKRHATAKDHAYIQWSIGSFNDGSTVVDIDTHLLGQGAEAYLSEIAISNNDYQQILDSKLNNYGHHSIGHINQHGVVLDSGTLTMNGIGKIHKQAKNADSQQENRLLMLSDQARGDANPILLIDEYEVTAGHAASVAKVDESQLWYLMSRGLDRKKAEYLVIRGFLMKTLNNIKDIQTRKLIVQALDHKLASILQDTQGELHD